MRWSIGWVLLLAGCADPIPSMPEGTAPEAMADALCPGHFHVALLVADGDEVLPYFTPGDDQDGSAPVQGIHMHSDDGIVHIHPAREACYALGWVTFAVGVHALQRDGGAVQVDDEVRNGTVRLDVQPWGGTWETWDLARFADVVPDAARVLLMVNPPTDVAALRDQVPEIPTRYSPS